MVGDGAAIACTYCAAEKRRDDGLLPAVERYLSQRISQLHARGPMLILSGEFGLIEPDHPLPWYDHLLLADEVDAMVPRVAKQLQNLAVSSIDFHTADPDIQPAVAPYMAVMEAACAAASVSLCWVFLPGDPE